MGEFRTKRIKLEFDEDERTITARFATFGVVDLDGDIIEKGAVGEQEVLLGNYNHAYEGLPPGVGQTYEKGRQALFKGTFLTTEAGEQYYQTLKQLKRAGYNMEWSWRFFVEEGGFEERSGEERYIIRKTKIAHVAPVETGAGINTGTLGVKSGGCGGGSCGTGGKAGSIDLEAFFKSPEFQAIQQRLIDDIKKSLKAEQPVTVFGNDPALNGSTVDVETTGTGLTIEVDFDGSADKSDFDETEAETPDNTETEAPDKAEVEASPQQLKLEEEEGCESSETTDQTAQDGAKGQSGQEGPSGCPKGEDGEPGEPGESKLLGAFLRTLRDQKGLTNEGLAEVTGLTVGSIDAIFDDYGDPPISVLKQLLSAMGSSLSVMVATLEAGSGEPQNSEAAASTEQTSKDGEGSCAVVKGDRLGQVLRDLRDDRELSNEDLADAAGISVSTMGQILGGTIVCPPVERLRGLARRLNVNLSRLINAAEQDGCDRYEAEESSRDADIGTQKTADQTTAEGSEEGDSTTDAVPTEGDINKQVDSLMAGLLGLPTEADLGAEAYREFEVAVASKED